jgi:hypothetical protein
VAANLLESWWSERPIIQYLKSNLHFTHLLPYRVLPLGVAILSIDTQAIFKSFWHLNAKLVCTFMASIVYRRDYSVASS